jgi:hypothetical protein
MKVALTVSLIGFIIFGFVFLRVRNKRRATPKVSPEPRTDKAEPEVIEGEYER